MIYLCDFKAIDFYAMSDCSNYFSHMDVGKGLDTVFDLMQNRIKNNRQLVNSLVILSLMSGQDFCHPYQRSNRMSTNRNYQVS